MYEDELARTDTTQRLFDVLRVETRGGRIPAHPGRHEPCAHELDVQSQSREKRPHGAPPLKLEGDCSCSKTCLVDYPALCSYGSVLQLG
jgi:hypothetical protein